jgi:hypothetical protein
MVQQFKWSNSSNGSTGDENDITNSSLAEVVIDDITNSSLAEVVIDDITNSSLAEVVIDASEIGYNEEGQQMFPGKWPPLTNKNNLLLSFL